MRKAIYVMTRTLEVTLHRIGMYVRGRSTDLAHAQLAGINFGSRRSGRAHATNLAIVVFEDILMLCIARYV